jgi:sec-independent protein translocase protein TatA
MPFGIQPFHIVLVVIVALLVFGPSKLPGLGRSVGKTIIEFRNGAKEMTESMKEEISKDPKSSTTNPVVSAQITPAAAISQPAVERVETAAKPVSTGSFCVQCGTSNPANAHFCKSCGNPLVA